MAVQINLLNAVATRCRQRLTSAGYSATPMTDEEALYTYFSVQHRRVSKKPRTVRKASYVTPAHLQAGEQLLLGKVAAGDDLWPNQSRKIGKATAQDGMLNDFGVQHFHLGAAKKPGTDIIEFALNNSFRLM